MAKMGLGYDLWVTTISDAINNIEDIDTIMDAFGVVDNLPQVISTRSISTQTMIRLFPLAWQEPLTGQSPRSNLRITLKS